MSPFDPPLTHGIGEAAGSERPSPGILCWNCRRLTPFPSGTCKWCHAAFAGSHGGAYTDSIPDHTVRAPVSAPALGSPVRPLKRIVRQLTVAAPTVEPAPREPAPATGWDSVPAGAPRQNSQIVPRASSAGPTTVPARSEALEECPVCGRTHAPDALRCQCGAVFGDTFTTVNCAECGSLMPIEADRCFVCGVALGEDGGATYACPLCGALVAAAASVCQCGAQFAD